MVRLRLLRRLVHACGVAASLLLPAVTLGAAADKLDNFQMRKAVPTELKQVAPDLYFLYDDISSNAAFLVTSGGVLVIDTRQHPAHGKDLIALAQSRSGRSHNRAA